MQKKYLIALIVVLGAVSIYLGVSLFSNQGYVYSNQNLNNFSNGEISFNYPDVFKLENSSANKSAIANNYISKLSNLQENEFIIINRQYNPPGHNNPKDFINVELKENESKFELIDNKKYTVNNVEIYDNTYKLKNDSSIEIRELWVYKNNAVYSIISSGKKSNAIDIIKNSLNIQTTQIAENPIFGTITIPKLNVKWNIRYDTLDIYSAVQKYEKSYYPGENGTIGLLGHHTHYSAPFNYLETLSKGDKVYINDFLTEKKYIYEVVPKNDTSDDIKDIRWHDSEYPENTNEFKKNDKELIMGTCWPPGYMRAGLYIHCKLISIEPI
jgi:sortase A